MNKILIIDDDVNALKLLGYTLRKAGLEILVAQNGIEGLEKAKAQIPNLIVTDLMMPKMDGYEVTRQIRANPTTAHIPIIMLTAKSQVHDKVAGFEAGVNDYVTKPVMPVELIARIKAHLSHPAATGPLQSKAKIIAFLGAKGGVGLTTLLVNMGIQLATDQKKKVLLIDLQTASGTICQQLGLANNNRLLELLKKPAAAISIETLNQIILPYKSGVKALPTPHGVYARYQPVNATQATALIKAADSMADYVLVDLGTAIDKTAEAVLRLAHQTCIVTEPTLMALDLAKRVIQYLIDIEANHQNDGIVLLNRSPSSHSFTLNQARAAFTIDVWGIVPPAPDLAFQASQSKTPMIMLQPNHIVLQQIKSLVPALT